MGMWFAKQPSGFRGWVAVVRANGTLVTGLAAGAFTVTVVNPGDSTTLTPSVSESTQLGGFYFFDITNTFLTAQGIGVYGVIVQIYGGGVRDAITNSLRVTVRDFDDLAQPGDAMVLTAGERTSIAAAVWAKVADGNILGLTAEQTIDLTRKILNNRLELKEGSVDNWILFDDDDATVLLDYDVTDKSGAAITIPDGAPARRTRGQ